jgi:hypothetical protein
VLLYIPAVRFLRIKCGNSILSGSGPFFTQARR